MTDRFVVRTVVLGLFALAAGSLIACVVLAMAAVELPEFLKYVGTTAIGAFAGVLAKTSTEPQHVVVQQPPDRPVPVTDGGHTTGEMLVLALLVAVVVVFLAVVLGWCGQR